jgi:hypothetical protein
MSTEVTKPESLLGELGTPQYRVIGSLLADNSLIPDVAAKLEPVDFLGVVGIGKGNATGAQLRLAAFDAIANRGARTIEAVSECFASGNNHFARPVAPEYVRAFEEKLDVFAPDEQFGELVALMVREKTKRAAALAALPDAGDDDAPPAVVTAGRFQTVRISCESPDEYKVPYVVAGVLPESQPTVLGGPPKATKTLHLLELGASIVIGSGSPFLGNPAFAVEKPRSFLLASAESGAATLRESFARICKAKGVDPRGVEREGFTLTTKVPRFSSAEEMADFDRLIGKTAAGGVVAVDPLYMAMGGGSGHTLNIAGEQLRPITEICEKHGATLIVAHHTVKSGRRGSLDLQSLVGAGVAEWARSWIILDPLAAFRPSTGEHRLRLSIGGSSGHCSEWTVNIREGRQDEPGGRVWDVRTHPGKERKASSRKGSEAGSGDEVAVLAALRFLGTAETKNVIGTTAKRSGEQAGRALESLVTAGTVRKCEISKGTRTFEAFELVDGGEHE